MINGVDSLFNFHTRSTIPNLQQYLETARHFDTCRHERLRSAVAKWKDYVDSGHSKSYCFRDNDERKEIFGNEFNEKFSESSLPTEDIDYSEQIIYKADFQLMTKQ